MKNILLIIAALASALGIIVSGYSLAAHYDTSLYEVCTVSETFDCSSVNTSKYSELFGIPVAGLGILGYLALLIFLLIFWIKKNTDFLQYAALIAFGALLFSFYLSGIEAFVLFKWCLFCIASQISILLAAVSIFWLYWFEIRDTKPIEPEEN